MGIDGYARERESLGPDLSTSPSNHTTIRGSGRPYPQIHTHISGAAPSALRQERPAPAALHVQGWAMGAFVASFVRSFVRSVSSYWGGCFAPCLCLSIYGVSPTAHFLRPEVPSHQLIYQKTYTKTKTKNLRSISTSRAWSAAAATRWSPRRKASHSSRWPSSVRPSVCVCLHCGPDHFYNPMNE